MTDDQLRNFIAAYLNEAEDQLLSIGEADSIKGLKAWGAFEPAEIKGVDPDAKTVTAVVSTGAVDRFNEIIEPSAFKPWLERFRTNPVLLKAHNHDWPIGSWKDIRITEEGLVGTAHFNTDNPHAAEWWPLYRDGDMRAFSVGVRIHEWEMREVGGEGDEAKRVRVFTNVELLEISAVSVPANPEAVVRAKAAQQQPASDEPDIEKTIRAAMKKELPAALREVFNGDPDCPGARLLKDVVQACAGSEGPAASYFDDVPRQASDGQRQDATHPVLEHLGYPSS